MNKRVIKDVNGIETPSIIHSWVYWHRKTNGWKNILEIVPDFFVRGDAFTEYYGGSCPVCSDTKTPKKGFDSAWGPLWCICTVENELARYRMINSEYASYFDTDASLATMRKTSNTVVAMVSAAKAFIEYPDKWLAFWGKPGVGKTHVISAVANHFGDLALFISASEFEEKLRSSLDDETTSEFIEALVSAPILILDDWGSEYSSSFVAAKLRSVISSRYSLWRERLTVVSTNYTIDAAMSKDTRVASRLLDKNVSVSVFISGSTPDYRMMERGE